MTLYPPLWSTNPLSQYTALADRQLFLRLWRNAGVIDFAGGHLKVSQRGAGANMSVDIAAGGAIIDGTDVSNQGRILASSDATVNAVVNAAPGAGTSRIDRIYARWRDADVLGGTSDWIIGYVAGTAAASPTAPALPASSIPLAQFTVLSSTTQITDGMITDQRVETAVGGRGLIVAEFGWASENWTNTQVKDKTLASPTVRPAGAALASQFWGAGNPTRAVAPFTGVYDMFVTPTIAVSGGYGWSIKIQKNTATDDVASTGLDPSTVRMSCAAVGIYMVAGDYFRVRIQNSTGATRAVTCGASGIPRMVYRGAA